MSFRSFIRNIHPPHFLTSKRKSETTHVGTTALLAVLTTLSLSWPQEGLTQSYKSNAANDSWMRQQQDQQRRQQQEQMRRQQQDDMRRQQQQQMQEQQRQQMRQQQQAKQRELIRQQQQKLSNDNKQKVIRDQQQKAANDNKQSETTRQKARSQGATYQGTNKPTGIVISNGIARMARPLTAGEIQRGFTGKVTADGRALIKFQNRIFTVPASRVSGLSARLAAEKQRKVRWTAQLQEGVNKKIKAIAITPPTATLRGPNGPNGRKGSNRSTRSNGPNGPNDECEPKDSPKCLGRGGGNEPPRDPPNISGCFPPESLRCQFNEAATRPGPVQTVSSPAVQARIDSARLVRVQNRKADSVTVETVPGQYLGDFTPSSTPLELVQKQTGQLTRTADIRFDHIFDGGVNTLKNGSKVGTGGHYLRSSNIRVTEITGMDNASGVRKGYISIRDPSTGGWVAKTTETTFYPSDWTKHRTRLEIEGAFQNSRPHSANPKQWVGISPSGVTIRGYYGRPAGTGATAWPQYKKEE